MIDFYKHSILSILGKDAGLLTEMEYTKMITDNYDDYLDKLQKVKLNIEDKDQTN